MITSSSIQYITRMLDEPRSLTDMDRESIAAIVKEYPYFVPARYMGAAIAHKKTPFDKEMMAGMWLYKGNWLLFNDFLAEAAKEDTIAKPREKIRFSLAKAEAEPEIMVTRTPLAEEHSLPVHEAVPMVHHEPAEQIPETVIAAVTAEPEPAEEVAAEAVPKIAEPEETVAAQIVHHEAELHEEEVETVAEAATIQPLIVKDDLLYYEEPHAAQADVETPAATKETGAAKGPATEVKDVVEEEGEEEDVLHEEREHEAVHEHGTTTQHVAAQSLYIDDDEANGDDDLIIKPLNYTVEQYDFNKEQITNQDGDTLILPVYTDNYFFHQGIKVSEDIPAEMDQVNKPQVGDAVNEKDKSLMVMMSFSEWLLHFKTKTQKEKEEVEDKRALKSMWQQEKLAAANEEENEEIPEEVFNMAVNSITKEEDLASEALAQIHRKQGKYDKAIEMYRKLSLRNPQKIAYFAHKIEELLKEKEL